MAKEVRKMPILARRIRRFVGHAQGPYPARLVVVFQRHKRQKHDILGELLGEDMQFLIHY